MPIRQLGYIHWSTDKFKEWRTYAVDVFGFMPVSGSDPDSMYFRIDDRPYRLVVSPAKAPTLTAIGFEVADDLELAATCTLLRDNGYEVEEGTDASMSLDPITMWPIPMSPVTNPVTSGVTTGTWSRTGP